MRKGRRGLLFILGIIGLFILIAVIVMGIGWFRANITGNAAQLPSVQQTTQCVGGFYLQTVVPVSASSSAAGFALSNIGDSDALSSWRSTSTIGQDIVFDAGAEKCLRSFQITLPPEVASTAFSVEVSGDGQLWTSVFAQGIQATISGSGEKQVFLPNVNGNPVGRYIRLSSIEQEFSQNTYSPVITSVETEEVYLGNLAGGNMIVSEDYCPSSIGLNRASTEVISPPRQSVQVNVTKRCMDAIIVNSPPSHINVTFDVQSSDDGRTWNTIMIKANVSETSKRVVLPKKTVSAMRLDSFGTPRPVNIFIPPIGKYIRIVNIVQDVKERNYVTISDIKVTSSARGFVCSDTDNGVNYSTQGTVNNFYTDSCLSRGALQEYSCSRDGKVQANTTFCQNGCVNGACQPFACSDSDNGINYYALGSVSSGWRKFADTCVSNTTVREYYCGTNAVSNTIYQCPAGCSGGVCMPAEKGYIRLTINESKSSNGVIVFSLIKAEQLSGNYDHLIRQYYAEDGATYILRESNGKTILNQYALTSGRFIIAEDFNETEPHGEIIELNEGMIEAVVPFAGNVIKLFVFDTQTNRTTELAYYPIASFSRTCKLQGEMGSFARDTDACCSGLMPVQLSGDALDFTCVACGDGICTSPESQFSCPEDCRG